MTALLLLGAGAGWTLYEAVNPTVPVSAAVAPLEPGSSQLLDLVLTNFHPLPLTVTSITVSVRLGAADPGCAGRDYITVSGGIDRPLTLPPFSRRSLQQLGVERSAWPVLTMRNAPENQDACAGAEVLLSYAVERRWL